MAKKQQRHVQVLEEAFSQVVSSRETLKVSTKGGIVLSVNKTLMLLHSPLLRSLSSSSTNSLASSSLLILPDTLPSALLAVEQLLERGTSVQTGAAPWQVQATARSLGIPMKRVQLEQAGPLHRRQVGEAGGGQDVQDRVVDGAGESQVLASNSQNGPNLTQGSSAGPPIAT